MCVFSTTGHWPLMKWSDRQKRTHVLTTHSLSLSLSHTHTHTHTHTQTPRPEREVGVSWCDPPGLSTSFDISLRSWHGRRTIASHARSGLRGVTETAWRTGPPPHREGVGQFIVQYCFTSILNWANVCSPNILRTVRRTNDSFLNWTFSSPNMVRTVRLTILRS